MAGETRSPDGNVSYTDFILLGFSGLQEFHPLLFIPFFCLYLVNVVANCTVIYTIQVEESLHSPMYLLISLLSAVGLCSTNAIMPQMLLAFLFHSGRVSLPSCLAQMFFIYLMIGMDSSVLLMMALDRYVAICKPLHYMNISMVCPMVVLASRLPFCQSNVIQHFACEHIALVSLACSSTSRNSILGMVVGAVILLFDTVCILASYASIVHTALQIASGSLRRKAFHTCSTQLLVMFFMYSSFLSSSIVYQAGQAISQDVHNLLSCIYLLLPSTVNPIIYGMRTKEIKQRVLRSFRRRHVAGAEPHEAFPARDDKALPSAAKKQALGATAEDIGG
ncbi:olfactory receptor 52K1-like [Malaclemys terrapin pileata]|uniref:olfactory receptor 52K1-like n=1 Tax=Malaclemys terrapin pileata TaxID=2991368 RepID=UPI0023A8334F|nr:olfactory receptor 52K1-like [Malaclemys terrapin pileata]